MIEKGEDITHAVGVHTTAICYDKEKGGDHDVLFEMVEGSDELGEDVLAEWKAFIHEFEPSHDELKCLLEKKELIIRFKGGLQSGTIDVDDHVGESLTKGAGDVWPLTSKNKAHASMIPALLFDVKRREFMAAAPSLACCPALRSDRPLPPRPRPQATRSTYAPRRTAFRRARRRIRRSRRSMISTSKSSRTTNPCRHLRKRATTRCAASLMMMTHLSCAVAPLLAADTCTTTSAPSMLETRSRRRGASTTSWQ